MMGIGSFDALTAIELDILLKDRITTHRFIKNIQHSNSFKV
jgi:hypothetical protein